MAQAAGRRCHRCWRPTARSTPPGACVGFPKSTPTCRPPGSTPARWTTSPRSRWSPPSSYGTLVHDLKDAPPARLQWRWRLDQPLTGGKAAPDLTTKAGDDAALKVCVMFDHPLERVPFVERTVLRSHAASAANPCRRPRSATSGTAAAPPACKAPTPTPAACATSACAAANAPTGPWVARAATWRKTYGPVCRRTAAGRADPAR